MRLEYKLGVGLGVGVGGVGSARLSDVTWDESLGAGAGAEGSLLLGVFVAPLSLLGLGPLALGFDPFANVLLPLPLLPLLPLPVLGVGTLAEPPPPPLPEVGPEAELVGVRTAGAMVGALPDAPGLEEEDDGAEAGAVGLFVAGVRGTIDALPGVAPGGVGGTGTSLCKRPLIHKLIALVKSPHSCLLLGPLGHNLL